jgi:hypothetical protein
MNAVNINNLRGTVIKVPDTTPGILSVNARQYLFILEGVWRSAIAPTPNQSVTVELDSAGVVTSVTVLDQQQLAKEKLSELSSVAQERGKVIAGQIAGQLQGGLLALAARMGALTLGAAVVIWIASYLLTAAGVSGGGMDIGSFSFRTLLGTDLGDPNSLANPGHARGLLRFIALLAIAVPFAVPFIRVSWARYLNAAPLVAVVLGWLVTHENVAKGFGQFGADNPFSFRWGFYVLLIACLVLAASSLKNPARAVNA